MEMGGRGGGKREWGESGGRGDDKTEATFWWIYLFLSEAMWRGKKKLLWTPSDIAKLVKVYVCCLELKPADITYWSILLH